VTRKALEILATHQPEPLAEDVAAALEEIACRAEGELAEVKFVS
jgi:hypothetical protein